MKTTTIERTSDTPAIMLDAERNWVEIIGNSYPENALEFYQPVYDWVKGSFAEGVTGLTIMLKLNYFNTSAFSISLAFFKNTI
jgi:hypothetical protein